MMKKYLFVILALVGFEGLAQIKPFRFAFISDTHISLPNGVPHQDLSRTVRDINGMSDVAFTVLTGDITELGTREEIQLARAILDSLDIPYYIIPGNHDTGWSESGGLDFSTIFGNDKFVFDYNGIRFFGCASGPYVRMSDGHVPRSAVIWMDSVLDNTPKEMPIIFLNHYPLDNGLDNWYEVTDRLRKRNTIAVLCGHGHRNRAMNFEDIPATMGRSNLRAKEQVGGYNLVDVRMDSIFFSERTPGIKTLPVWRKIKIENRDYDAGTNFPRPEYAGNKEYPQVKARWTFSSDANVISTPAVSNGLVIFGNQNGTVQALSLKDGSKKWTIETGGPIFSSPAATEKHVVFGSTDGYVYCIDPLSGTIWWKFKTDAAVLGSPVINKDVVYIGGSDGYFRSFDLNTGKERWNFKGINGPVVSTPLLDKNKIIFGAWDTNLYALDKKTGQLIWKWTNGSPVRNYSPASCIPVANKGVVYIAAPDRYLSAIEASTGKTLWRTKEGGLRESIGISNDGKLIYGKSMQDTLVAYATGKELHKPVWKMFCGYGYEHVPSMLIEKDHQVFFGTRSGVVYAIDPLQRRVDWLYKIDNSMVNTINILSSREIVASTMDGKVVFLEIKKE
ncbi:MAG TPA: PQQ-binding-like beta-propeller repeat protein [Cyclobacteriaceae bacterium]|nr:PQQ-binding-like beta-propeller repeat protein [Cyclobacteriaceae bacterium]